METLFKVEPFSKGFRVRCQCCQRCFKSESGINQHRAGKFHALLEEQIALAGELAEANKTIQKQRDLKRFYKNELKRFEQSN